VTGVDTAGEAAGSDASEITTGSPALADMATTTGRSLTLAARMTAGAETVAETGRAFSRAGLKLPMMKSSNGSSCAVAAKQASKAAQMRVR
jgi:hypothetical protein